MNSFVQQHNLCPARVEVAGFRLQPFRAIAFSSDIDMGKLCVQSRLQSNPRAVSVIVPIAMSLLILL
jgi:hypothetical protein